MFEDEEVLTQEDYKKIAHYMYDHLKEQGCTSVAKDIKTSNGLCRYRGDNNTKCAIGFLISDEDYDPEMEGESVAAYLIKKAAVAGSLRILNKTEISYYSESDFAVFLDNAQRLLHDSISIKSGSILNFNFLKELDKGLNRLYVRMNWEMDK